MSRYVRWFALLSMLLPVLAWADDLLLPRDEPTYAVRTTNAIVYGTGAGQGGASSEPLILDLYEPLIDDPNVEALPVVILIHGGGFVGGSRSDSRLVTMAE
ncbi:MAG: hypothetical protein AAGJ52_06410, partial [Pseudomonadota bacterium]